MKPEDKLAISLIGSQLAMIVAVVAIVSSPSYSRHFNQSLKEQSLQNFRVSGSFTRVTSTAELNKIFHKPGLGAGVEIHADEQMALEAIGRKSSHVKDNLSKMRHHVDTIRKANDTTSSIANIALLKLIRVELAAAEMYLSVGAYPRAQALVTAATDDLKHQSAFFEEEPQRFNLQRIFDLTARINHSEGDTAGEQRAQALKMTLSDPAAASEWFRTHGMKGYYGSYPPEYLIKILLSFDNKNSRATVLAQALEACKNPAVRPSTRTLVINTAYHEADDLHAPSLATTAVNVWIKYCSKAPIQFEPDAFLVYSLKDQLVRKGNADTRSLIRSKMKECIDKKLLPKPCMQTYFDSYESDQILIGVWPPPSPQAATGCVKEIDGLLDLCHQSGCDDFSLKLSKLVALTATRENAAEQLAYEILDRMRTSRTAEQSKIDRIRFVNALAGVVYCMAKPHTPESNAKTRRLLERVLANCKWEDNHRLSLLISYYDYVPLSEKAKRDSLLNEIFALDRKVKLEGSQRLNFSFFVLNNIMIGQNKPDEGKKMMEEFAASCGSDISSFAQLSQQLLGYRRAYPSYNSETLKICKEKAFPAKYFEETPNLVAEVDGKRSARYCRCLLWLSQFEFCRGNNDRALQLTNELLAIPGVERTDSYFAAKDFKIQLLGEKPPRAEGEIIAPRDTHIELECLSNIYYQLHMPDAVARIDAFRALVREK